MRYDWLKQINTIESPVDTTQIQVFDVLNIDWNSFQFTSGYTSHVVSKQEAQRPWLIAFKFYNSALYEDFIYLVNQIKNPLDLIPGQILKIPVLKDIQGFIVGIKQ